MQLEKIPFYNRYLGGNDKYLVLLENNKVEMHQRSSCQLLTKGNCWLTSYVPHLLQTNHFIFYTQEHKQWSQVKIGQNDISQYSCVILPMVNLVTLKCKLEKTQFYDRYLGGNDKYVALHTKKKNKVEIHHTSASTYTCVAILQS